MKRKHAFFVWHIWGILMIFALGNVSTSAILVSTDGVPARRVLYEEYNFPARASFTRYNSHLLRGVHVPLRDAFPVSKKDVFRIEPSDALVDSKWSQPVAEHRQIAFHTDHNMGRPAAIPFNRDIPGYFSVPEKKTVRKISDQSDSHAFKSTVSNIGKEYEEVDKDSFFSKLTPASDHKSNDSLWLDPRDTLDELEKKEHSFSEREAHLNKNNFTDSNDSQIYVPSNSVLNYQPSSDTTKNSESKLNFEDMPQSDSSHDMTGIESTQTGNAFTFYATDTLPYDRDALQKETAITRIFFETPASPKSTGSKVLEYFTSTESFVTDTPTTLNYSTTKTNNSEENVGNLPSADSTVGFKLSSGAVTGIVIAVLVCVTLVTSAVIYLLYRRYSGKCTSVVDGKYNSDNCGYLDDSLRSSVYLNNHIELPKENSEEMTSLDNDSFLNSLETMTIQNYWADNTKNTKV